MSVTITVGVDRGENLDKILKVAEVSKMAIPITVFGWDLVYKVTETKETFGPAGRCIYVLKETMLQ